MGKKKISASFFWRLAFVTLILVLLAEIGFMWMSGNKETADAFLSGRRLIITLEDGKIDGKIISSEVATTPENTIEKPSEQINPTEVDLPKTEPKTEEKAEVALPEKPPEPIIIDNTEIVNTITTATDDDKTTFPPLVPSISPPAPLSQEMIEKTSYGNLPKIGEKGEKYWKFYAKPVVIKNQKPMIAIIVTGLGTNKQITEQALRLPEAVNLSFSPYSKDLSGWMTHSRLSGHEILIDLPMESANYPASDPGPLGLLVSKEQNENENRIKKLMAHDVGFVGFITPQDEVFLANPELFKSLLQVLSGRGLMLVVGKPPAKNESKELIEKGMTANVVADTLIDEELTSTAIQARLTLLEQTAKQKGVAVGIAQGYPITIKQLKEWSTKAEENGFIIVPVSMIISKNM